MAAPQALSLYSTAAGADAAGRQGVSAGRLRVVGALRVALALLVLGQLGRVPLVSAGSKDAPLLVNDLLVIGLLLFGLLAAVHRRKAWLDLPAVLALLFAAVGAASAVLAIPRFGLSGFQLAFSLAYLARWLVYFGVYLIAINFIRRTDVGAVWGTLETAVLVFAGFGILQSAFLPGFAQMVYPDAGVYTDWDPQGRRLVSTFLDPNFAGALIVITLLVQLARLAFGAPVSAIRVLVLFVALVLTLSRSSLLALTVGALVLVAARGLSRRLLRLGLLLGIAILPLLPYILSFAAQYNKLSLDDPSLLGRFIAWSRAIELLLDHPAIGVGFNTYGFVQQKVFDASDLYASSFGLDGGLLFVGVMTGLVGVILYGGMHVVVLLRCRRAWRISTRPAEERALALGVAAATVALLVHSLFLNSLLYPFLMQVLWVMWGLVFALGKGGGGRGSTAVRATTPWRRSAAPAALRLAPRALLVALGLSVAATPASAQVPDSVSGVVRMPLLERDPVSLFSLHPLWSGDPYLDLPGQVEVRLGAFSLSDRWGRDRLTTPHLASRAFRRLAGASTSMIAAPSLVVGAAALRPFTADPGVGSFEGAVLELTPRSAPDDLGFAAETSLQSAALVGHFLFNPALPNVSFEWPDFTELAAGAVVGGPLGPDLSFVAAGQYRRYDRRDFGFAFERDSERLLQVSLDTVRRFQQSLEDVYGRDDGGFEAVRLGGPSGSIYSRLDWRLGPDAELALSALASTGEDELERRRDPFALASGFYSFRSALRATALEARWQLLDGISSESALWLRSAEEWVDPAGRFPEVEISVRGFTEGEPIGPITLGAGSHWEAQGDTVRDRSVGIRNAVHARVGPVDVEVGASVELTRALRVERPGWRGRYRFQSLAALDARTPDLFETMRYGAGAGVAEFETVESALWAGGAWAPVDQLRLRAGARLPIRRYSTAPPLDPALISVFGAAPVATPRTETGVLPRVEAVWTTPLQGLELRAVWSAQLGRLPYEALAAVYAPGLAVFERCTAPVPHLTAHEPPACDGTLAAGQAVQRAPVFFESALQAPEWRHALIGAAYQLGSWRFAATHLSSSARAELAVRNFNLQAAPPGSIGAVTPVDPTYGPVYGLTTRSGGRERRWVGSVEGSVAGFEVAGSVLFHDREDYASITAAAPGDRLRATAVTGDPNDPALATSRLTVDDRVGLMVGRRFGDALHVRLLYTDRAGVPYSWATLGDPNRDGIEGNDLASVPAPTKSVRWINDGHPDLFDALVAATPCLEAARGRTLQRNECRGPRLRRLDVWAELALPIRGLSVWLDVVNLGNALSEDWGAVQIPPEVVPLTRFVRRDVVTGEDWYELVAGQVILDTQRPESMWRAQLGARVTLW